MNILLVDDDPDIRFLAEFVLEQSGDFDVTIAETAEQANRKMQTIHFDGILLDVILPDTSGVDFYENLLDQQGKDAPPVVFLTAKEGDEFSDKMQALGAAGVIQKPFDPAALPEQVLTLLTQD